MSIKVEKTMLDGVQLITPSCFEDFRGYYIETYNKELYHAAGISIDFIQDDISVSDRHVLRGIHGDAQTWKLVSCLHGKFYLVVLDARTETESFGRWEAFTLTEANRKQVLIPPGFGNAHLVLSEKAVFQYKQSTYYNPEGQFTYRYDDPRFAIYWPVADPVLSRRDHKGAW